MERYPVYKDSGIEWIGEIPEGWEVRRLRFIGSSRSGMGNKKPEDFGHGSPFVSYGDVYKHDVLQEPSGLVSAPKTDMVRFSVRRGDIFFTGSSETIEELGYSSVCLTTIPDATFNGFTIRVRPFGTDVLIPEYSRYLCRSEIVRGYLTQTDNSITRANLSQHTLMDMSIILPPLSEQRAIASYLDIKTSELDSLMADLERSITLLEEYRRSVISEAVTKGLDPTVPMKDSGVEWIGEIPENWKVNRLKYLARISGGATPSKDNLEYWEGAIPWVSSMEVKSDLLTDTSLHITREAVNSCSTDVYPAGTIVMVVRSGILKHTLPVAKLDIPMSVNQDIKALEFVDPSLASYFMYFVQGLNNQLLIALGKDGSTVDNLDVDLVARCPVTLPSSSERCTIVAYLDAKTAEIDSLIADKRSLIDRLKEYRRSLISEAVTGKFKVPGVDVA